MIILRLTSYKEINEIRITFQETKLQIIFSYTDLILFCKLSETDTILCVQLRIYH